MSEATCRGCYELGTACGQCGRCKADPMNPDNRIKYPENETGGASLKILKFPDPKPLSGQPGPAGETTTPIEFMKINSKIYVSLNDLALWVARSKVKAVEKDELFHSLNRMNDHALANLPEAFQVQK